MELSEQSINI